VLRSACSIAVVTAGSPLLVVCAARGSGGVGRQVRRAGYPPDFRSGPVW
jgi:hypothetical protein